MTYERWQFSHVQYKVTKVHRWVLHPSLQYTSDEDSDADFGSAVIAGEMTADLHAQRAAPQGGLVHGVQPNSVMAVLPDIDVDFCYSHTRDARPMEASDEEGGGSTRKADYTLDYSPQDQSSSTRSEENDPPQRMGGWQRLPVRGAAVVAGPGAWRRGEFAHSEQFP